MHLREQVYKTKLVLEMPKKNKLKLSFFKMLIPFNES